VGAGAKGPGIAATYGKINIHVAIHWRLMCVKANFQRGKPFFNCRASPNPGFKSLFLLSFFFSPSKNQANFLDLTLIFWLATSLS
jgi:hypothetical protein